MGYINRPKHKQNKPEPHKNWMGGDSYTISALTRLRIAASSCFFGEPMYYHRDAEDTRPRRRVDAYDQNLSDSELEMLRETLNEVDPQLTSWRSKTPASMMESAIDAALDEDVEATLQEAARLRNEENIRVTPQVIMVRAAHHENARGTGLIRKYAPYIMLRGDEPATQLAYQLAAYGRQSIPNALKKSWRDYLEKLDDYGAAKYRQDSRTVSMVDVMNLVHPKSKTMNKLAKDELRVTNRTWEAIISEYGSNPAAWHQAIEVMGHMALLRNLRNLLQHQVNPDEFMPKLLKGAEGGRQLPFRYFSAYRAVLEMTTPSYVANPWASWERISQDGKDNQQKVLRGIEAAMMRSVMKGVKTFKGRTMSLCDNSGSARGTTASSMGTMAINEIANLTAGITAMASDEGYVGVFGDRLAEYTWDSRRSLMQQVMEINHTGKQVGAGTEHGIWLFWQKAITEKEHWDHVFIYSDMQAGHGELYGLGGYPVWGPRNSRPYINVPELVKEYRKKVNPNVHVYLVQVAGYQDTLIPEWYDRAYILGGWGDGILRFAAEMAKINGG